MAGIIYKYSLEITDEQWVTMPTGARILSTQWQGDGLVAWAIVDPKAAPRPQMVRVIGTGNPMPEFSDHFVFVGTVQEPARPLVWHVFSDPSLIF
jgi:hypothetical protein